MCYKYLDKFWKVQLGTKMFMNIFIKEMQSRNLKKRTFHRI